MIFCPPPTVKILTFPAVAVMVPVILPEPAYVRLKFSEALTANDDEPFAGRMLPALFN